jgi:hypothetical protein
MPRLKMDVHQFMKECNGHASPSSALVKGLARELDLSESMLDRLSKQSPHSPEILGQVDVDPGVLGLRSWITSTWIRRRPWLGMRPMRFSRAG